MNSNKSVLLVEHDSKDRGLYETALKAAGYAVTACADAAAALAAASAGKPDALITRVLLPDLDGFELIEKIRASAPKSPAIIVLTILKDADTRARAIARGAVYLAKPAPPEKLVSALNNLLAARTPQAAQAAKIPDFAIEKFIEFLAAKGRVGAAARGRLNAAKPRNMRQLAEALGLPLSELTPLAAEHLGLKTAKEIKLQEVLPGILSPNYCQKNKVLALNHDGVHCMTVCDPFDLETLGTLYNAGGGKFSLLLAEEEALTAVFREGLDLISAERSAELSGADGFENEKIDDAHPVAKISAELLSEAAAQRASDIHIEPDAAGAVVRFRIDGGLRKVLSLRPDVAARLVTRYKAMASLDTANSRKPQDGAFETNISGRQYRVRLATVASGSGEAAVLRLLDPKASPPSLEALGFAPAQAAELLRLADSPTGLLVFAGPTGSGKTTSIRSFLNLVGTRKYSVITVEDPIEYELPGAKQLQVNDKAGAGLESLLRSVVRLDPDVLFMGEVRDPATAGIAFDFASTGHFTVATLHASSAEEVPYRFSRLGMDPHVVSEQTTAVVAQRLAPKLCPACKTATPPSPEESAHLESLGVKPALLYTSPGCPACRMTGVQGREVIAEVLVMDAQLRKLVAAGSTKDQLDAALNARPGYLTLSRHAAMKVAAGVCAYDAAFELVAEPEKNDSETEKLLAKGRKA
ncbi:MAG: ATPase, T2SS/T4P/T4SS family [Elusimicrobiales bacterium]|nr:ATPase, T2SS/T4P/T4SS family [Elusimicrobiales bacterium]